MENEETEEMISKDYFIFRNEEGKLLPIIAPYSERKIDEKTKKRVQIVKGYVKFIPLTIGKINELKDIERDPIKQTRDDMIKLAKVICDHYLEPKFDSPEEIVDFGSAKISRLFAVLQLNSIPKIKKKV